MTDENFDAFLAECEKEQLHLSGRIQPHGTLLAVSHHYIVEHIAANFKEFTGIELEPGSRLSENLLHLIEEQQPEAGQKKYSLVTLNNKAFRLTVSVNHDSLTIVELSRLIERVDSYVPKETLSPQNDAEMKAEILRITERVAELSGFQRVMYYVFREDGDGEVIEEVCDREKYGSFLGLRFPASDIPQIARNLYMKNPWRLIADVNAKPVDILSASDKPVDLTESDLRSVSPVHVAYLNNMQVQSSVSFAIVINNRLHGLIACHHSLPFVPDIARIEFIAKEVKAHTLTILSYRASYKIRLIDRFSESFNFRFEDDSDEPVSLQNIWSDFSEWLSREFDCEGVIVRLDENIYAEGTVPGQKLWQALLYFFANNPVTTWFTDSLRNSLREIPLSEICGVYYLNVRNGGESDLHIFLFREEYLHEVHWGGNPNKPAEQIEEGKVISPRHSFEKWIEKRLGYARSWTSDDHLKAARLRQNLSEVEITA